MKKIRVFLYLWWFYIKSMIRSAIGGFSLNEKESTNKYKEDVYEPEVDTENLRRQEVIAHTIDFLKITGIPEDKYSNQHDYFTHEFSIDVRLESVRKENIGNGDTTDKDKFSWKDEDDNRW